MKRINIMLSEYAESHQNKTNQVIHKFCVPAIVMSVLGLLASIPIPFDFPSFIHLGSLIGALCLLYYFFLSLKYFLLMLPTLVIMLYLLNVFQENGFLLLFSSIVFIISWIIQVWGHKIEGKKPSFLKDVFFLLIGPLWVFKSLLNLKDE
jgi:uncharacterized membrane protein YGL010W